MDLLAVITLGSGRRRDDVPGYAELAHAIARRRTHRGPFLDTAVPDAVIAGLDAALSQHAVTPRWVPPGPGRGNVADLVDRGDRAQFADPTWRRELASWMRPRRHGDGLTVPTLTGAVTRFIVSHVDLGHRTGTKDAELTTRAPLVVALATIGDQPEDWLITGRALQHLLLKAAFAGVQAGYANQPCQVAQLRPALRRTLALQGHPQLLLRLGFPPHATPATPRRPIHDTADTTPDGHPGGHAVQR